MSNEKTTRMQLLELRRQTKVEQLLREHFAAGMSKDEVAQALGISRVTLDIWLDRLEAKLVRSYHVSFPSEETAGASK